MIILKKFLIDACEKDACEVDERARGELSQLTARFQLARVSHARVQLFVLFLILLISISGCRGRGDTKTSIEDVRVGTQGIVMSFLPNSPPDTIHIDADNTFDVLLEVRNLGAFPQPEEISKIFSDNEFGRIHLSGYDINILLFDYTGLGLDYRRLNGRSTINPNGGEDVLKFKGEVIVNHLNVEKYEPTLLVTACYKYATIAGPPVCIDPQPYSTVRERRVCEVQDISLSSQGAPVAVTKIEEEALAQKTLFKITIKNVGNGDIIKLESYNKCNPFYTADGKLEREDIDKVNLVEARIGDKSLQCAPFIDDEVKSTSGYVRLINGEGTIICELPKSEYAGSKTAYTTPLQIVLSYVYRNTINKRLQIIKESTSIG